MVEVNVVTTKTIIVVTESDEIDKKIVATQIRMLRHNNELNANISVVTKENYVFIIKSAESEISIMTEKFSVATENGR